MKIECLCIRVILILQLSYALAPEEILILVLSQATKYHKQLSEKLRFDIHQQSFSTFQNYSINVYMLHELYNFPGDWTFLATLPYLIKSSNIINSNLKWVILCEETTQIKLSLLINKLSKENHTQLLYLGYPLYDYEATIIHHFAFFENPGWFPYPMLRCGIALTIPLIRKLAMLVAHIKPKTEFFIDASHELALFIMENVGIYNHKHLDKTQFTVNSLTKTISGFISHVAVRSSDTNGFFSKDITNNQLLISAASYVCPTLEYNKKCAMYATSADTSTCNPVSRDSIYFAIKTCHKFFMDRIPIIEKTWGKYTVHKRFFSDIKNEEIPTIATGVPNTATGHCVKTLLILKIVLEDIGKLNGSLNNPIEWIFLADDDTLLSVSGVCDILGCFNPKDDIYLGERYGYRLYSQDGFNYITGGGGIVFTLSTVEKILHSCTCPTSSSPDDMILGACLHRLEVNAIHTPRFHQARPLDYASELLKIDKPITFHKFWQLNPETVYSTWFGHDDARLQAIPAKISLSDSNRENSSYKDRKPDASRSNNFTKAMPRMKADHIDL